MSAKDAIKQVHMGVGDRIVLGIKWNEHSVLHTTIHINVCNGALAVQIVLLFRPSSLWLSSINQWSSLHHVYAD